MSDVIDRAIEKQYHINNLSMLKDVRWKDFESTLRNRRLFLYGLGCAIPFLWKKYVYSLCVTGCIDRDKKAIGDRWELRVASFSHPAEYECRIAGPDILDKYNTDDVVILVLSLRQYAEICCDLANKGYHNVFSLLTMEAGEREKSRDKKSMWILLKAGLARIGNCQLYKIRYLY